MPLMTFGLEEDQLPTKEEWQRRKKIRIEPLKASDKENTISDINETKRIEKI